MSKLPRWKARNERDNRDMMDWLSDRVDERLSAATSAGNKPSRRDLITIGIENAGRGDARLLKNLFPEIAQFIVAPRPGRGEYIRKRNTAVDAAIAYQKLIKQVWRKHYGKSNRTKDEWSAADFAERLLGVKSGSIARRQRDGNKAGA